jgi:hypothetical protein
MLIELLVAAAVTASPVALPPLDPVPPPPPRLQGEQRLPNGGRACLILTRCDARPCVVPAQRRPPRLRCGPPAARPAPRVIPARG